MRLQLANVDSKVAGLEERAKARELHSEKAMRIIYEIVNNRVSYLVEEIVKAFSYAPKEILVHAFGYLETIRKQTVFNLLDSENETEDRKYLIRTRLEGFIPLLMGLIKIEELDQSIETRKTRHFHYASLAFLFKDKNNPDWENALCYIEKAINIHNGAYEKEKTPTTYLFNLLICSINSRMSSKEDSLIAFDDLLKQSADALDMLIRARPVIAPGLRTWLFEYGKERILSKASRLSSHEVEEWREFFQLETT